MTELHAVVEAQSLFSFVPSNLPCLIVSRRTSCTSTVRVCAVGDIALGGQVQEAAHQEGLAALVQDIAPLLQSADIAFCNLEGPLLHPLPHDEIFAAPTSAAHDLASSGFTLLNLANNHIYDHGHVGLSSTLDALQESHLQPLGAGPDPQSARQLVRISANGHRTGWLGCGRTHREQNSGGPNYWELNEAELTAAIQKARQEVDLLVVSIHGGLMYLDYPDPADVLLAENLTSAGADIILMHHAHVLQGVQVIEENKLVCYNLGNFLIDWEAGEVRADIAVENQLEGAVFVFELDSRGICLSAVLPTWIDDSYHVRWATGERGQHILDRLMRISHALERDYQTEFLSQRVERNARHTLRVLWHHARRGNLDVVLSSARQVRPRHLLLLISWVFKSFITRPWSRLWRQMGPTRNSG